MADNRLLNYIKANLANGASEEQVRNALAEVGWAEDLVNEAFTELNKPKEEEFIELSMDQPIKESNSVKMLWVILVLIVISLTIGIVAFVVMNSEEKNGEAKTIDSNILMEEESEVETIIEEELPINDEEVILDENTEEDVLAVDELMEEEPLVEESTVETETAIELPEESILPEVIE